MATVTNQIWLRQRFIYPSPFQDVDPRTAISRTRTFFLSNHVTSLSLLLLLHPYLPKIVFPFPFLPFLSSLSLMSSPATIPLLLFCPHLTSKWRWKVRSVFGPKNASLCVGHRTMQSDEAASRQRGGLSPTCCLMAPCVLCARALISSTLYEYSDMFLVWTIFLKRGVKTPTLYALFCFIFLLVLFYHFTTFLFLPCIFIALLISFPFN